MRAMTTPTDARKWIDVITAHLRRELEKVTANRGFFGRVTIDVFIAKGEITGYETQARQVHK